MRGIRGAITVDSNSREAILEASRELLLAMIEANRLEPEEVVSVFFSLTPDLNAAFPAQSARELGWTRVPLFCVQEIPVPGALPRVLRILMHVNRDVGLDEVRHVYLRGARALRTDLTEPGWT